MGNYAALTGNVTKISPNQANMRIAHTIRVSFMHVCFFAIDGYLPEDAGTGAHLFEWANEIASEKGAQCKRVLVLAMSAGKTYLIGALREP